MRRESERIGIRRTENSVSVPGFLMNGNHASVAKLGEGDRPVTTAAQGRPAVAERLELTPGRWRVEVGGTRGPLRARVFRAAAGAGAAYTEGELLLDGQAPAVFDFGGGTVNVELTPAGGEAVEVRGLVLARVVE